MDDVVEGLTLGFTSLLSVQLLLFSTVVFFSKNVLEGFTEATVLKWNGSSASRIWGAGMAAVVVAAAAVTWLDLGESSHTLLFAGATGMLLYVSAFQLARTLEWNSQQKICALGGFVLTGIIAGVIENA